MRSVTYSPEWRANSAGVRLLVTMMGTMRQYRVSMMENISSATHSDHRHLSQSSNTTNLTDFQLGSAQPGVSLPSNERRFSCMRRARETNGAEASSDWAGLRACQSFHMATAAWVLPVPFGPWRSRPRPPPQSHA